MRQYRIHYGIEFMNPVSDLKRLHF